MKNTTPAYATEYAQRLLLLVARSWIGTPFRKGSSVKQGGVDCVHLAASIYAASGHKFVWNPPAYSLDGGRHMERSQVTDWLDGSQAFEKCKSATIGDLLLFKVGDLEHHVGVVITASTFIHSIRRIGTIESNLADPTWSGRISMTYRPVNMIFIPA